MKPTSAPMIPAVALAILLSSSTALCGASADDFFDGPAVQQGDPMFFGIYAVFPSDHGNDNVQKIADGHFTAAGPYFGAEHDPAISSTAFYNRINQNHSHGMGHVAHVPMHPDVVNDTDGFVRGDSMEAIPESDLRAHVRTFLDVTLGSPVANDTVAVWFVLPEELRPWRAAEMDYLQIVVEEVKAHDPLKRPVTMYNPNHRPAGQLETIVRLGLDWTMMGVYATDVTFDTRGARVRDGVDRILTAAQNTQTQPVAVFQLSQDYETADLRTLAENLGNISDAEAIKHVVRHDVYQGLVRGVRGVQVWSGCDCRAGLTTYSAQLEGYTSISTDVNGELALAEVLLSGERRDDLTATLLSGPATVTHEGTTVDTINMADIAYGDARYLFLVNSANSELSIEVGGLPTDVPLRFEDLFNNTPEMHLDPGAASFTLQMQPLEVIGLRFVPVPEPGTVALLALFGLSSGMALGLQQVRRSISRAAW